MKLQFRVNKNNKAFNTKCRQNTSWKLAWLFYGESDNFRLAALAFKRLAVQQLSRDQIFVYKRRQLSMEERDKNLSVSKNNKTGTTNNNNSFNFTCEFTYLNCLFFVKDLPDWNNNNNNNNNNNILDKERQFRYVNSQVKLNEFLQINHRCHFTKKIQFHLTL
jgi:hypothetical protein